LATNLPKLVDAAHLIALIGAAEMLGKDFLFVRGSRSLGSLPAVVAERGGRCSQLRVY
jgi:uroporphyrinogen-III synthase